MFNQSMNNPQPSAPVATHILRETTSYAEAQAIVDKLSDKGFPVENVRIVGTGLRSVEQVMGRMTKGKAAAAGAASGAWFGLFIGLLFGLFASGVNWWGLILGGLIFGAVWGAVFGYMAHWSTRGKRDFASVKTFEAANYEVHVSAPHFEEASRVLGPI
ncbi:hypothetical protein CLV47_101231 [Antricoccus suffuscus]|uniref:General stress protein 17M-like domain-containing protein n=1 Tax=Antricoccus suffuscus TaxID=1629062 RepID=A0A2T1A692_9ACTN|nr:general stress protein [Antricoccus suffuscus]PRZ44106.1 hypothetical protein CLV47_101231 [Antricoccus suffuscus]